MYKEKTKNADVPKPQDDCRDKTAGAQPCGDAFRPDADLDGRNDSGPEPEVHGRDLPPQD